MTKKLLKISKPLVLTLFLLVILGITVPDIALGILGEAGDPFTRVIERVARVVRNIAIAAGGLFIIIAAIQFLAAGGDAERVSQAKQSLIYAVVGIVIAASAAAIARWAERIAE